MGSSRITACISLDAIEANIRQMRANIKEGTKIVAVVKADGYGHGAVPLAHLLEPMEEIWGFAVATCEEAIRLREAGIEKEILILGYVFAEDYHRIVQYELQPAVFSVEMARGLAAAAAELHQEVRIHLAVDTGMSRIGFLDQEESVEEINRIAQLPGIRIEGSFTHFARADEKSVEPARRQLERFQAFLRKLEEAGVDPGLRHCSNSAAIMQFPEANLDLVRAGISMYGLYPSQETDSSRVSLTPAMRLVSHISHLKRLPAGVAVSYGGTYTTEGETQVATIPVGYGDGYARALSNKGYVLIRGQKAPIIGRVCMDQFMVDVTHIPGVQKLDQVVLLGKDQEQTITMEQLGDLSGRFNYEFACCINQRVPRVYTGGNMNNSREKGKYYG